MLGVGVGKINKEVERKEEAEQKSQKMMSQALAG